MGITAAGWDPYFEDHAPVRPHDVVLLTYVLNVIEDPGERVATLRSAWAQARRVLVVTSRLSWDARRVHGRSYEDGVVTSRGTFQHLYRPAELRQVVEEHTQVRAIAAAPGVVYAFRSDEDRLEFLARTTLSSFDWRTSEDYGSALAAVVSFAEERGRIPTFEEIPPDLLTMLGRTPWQELARVTRKAARPELVQRGARRTILETLLYLAIDLFNGRGSLSSMPVTVQADIRGLFKSYREACQRADRLLLKLRDDAYLRGAMRNSVGKLTPTALYVHRRAISHMPVVLRLYEYCGSVAAGRPAEFTLVKLHHDRRAVAWLGYPEFDTDPHPRTAWSYRVTFPDLETSFEDFTGRRNRPLLHRKEEFLAPDDPARPKYERLTRSEVTAGLYLRPHLIGTEDGWRAELDRCGVTLRGHRLVRVRSAGDAIDDGAQTR